MASTGGKPATPANFLVGCSFAFWAAVVVADFELSSAELLRTRSVFRFLQSSLPKIELVSSSSGGESARSCCFQLLTLAMLSFSVMSSALSLAALISACLFFSASSFRLSSSFCFCRRRWMKDVWVGAAGSSSGTCSYITLHCKFSVITVFIALLQFFVQLFGCPVASV